MLKKRDLSHIVMSHIRDTSYMADVETHELIYINETVKKLLDEFHHTAGLEGSEYIGQKCHKVLAGLDEPCSFCAIKHLVMGEEYIWENCNPLIEKWFELHDTLIEIDGRTVMLEISKDINDAKKKMENLETQLTDEEMLVQCAQTLAENSDMDIAIHSLLEIIGEFYKADEVIILEINNSNNMFVSNSYEWVREGIESQKDQLQEISFANLKGILDAIEKDNEIYIASTEEDKIFNYETYIEMELKGLKSFMASSLKIGDKTIGFLSINNPKIKCSKMKLLHSVSLFIANDLEKREQLDEFKRLASVDVFTGLYNRNKYLETIRKIIEDKIEVVGIVYLDINGLKLINDTYGHEQGDIIIQKVVSIVKECFFENIYRIGGDEFVVLYMDRDHVEFEEKVLNLRTIVNRQSAVSLAIGAVWCTETFDISNQIAHANELMHIGKRHYYDTHQLTIKNQRALMAKNLQNDIANNEFVVFLQPKIRLSDEQIIGAEALVRKKDGKGGLIPPDKFISVYETDGIISYLDFAVLENTCILLNKWNENGHPMISISVNFSRVTILEHNIAEKINNICQKYGIDSSYIIIELTERISNISLSNLNEIITSIKNYGFKISLDDFGTEYSNLAILTNIAFDEIKLDKSLIDNMSSNPAIGTVIEYASKMCNAFRHTEMVMEGIETFDQLEILRNMNCDLNIGQGYYFSRPLSINQFMEYFDNKLLEQ